MKIKGEIMEMKTIKQIADELGVSKQTIRNEIAKLGLRSTLRKNANQFLVDEKQDKLIKSSFLDEKSQSKSQSKTQTLQSESQSTLRNFSNKNTSNDVIDTVIEMLKKELDIKNKHIEEQANQIKELVKVIDQEQQLRLLDKQKIMELEQGKETEENSSEDKPKSFFERIMTSLRG